MFSYFRGGKRKAGLAALSLACVFSVGWVRSYFMEDLLQIPSGSKSTIQAASAYSILMIIKVQSDSDDEQMKYYGFHSFRLRDSGRMVRIGNHMFFFRPDEISLDSFKSQVGTQIIGKSTYSWQSLQIPYFSIVVPLTLFSAWLLLSKRRQPTKSDVSQETAA